MSTYAVTPGGGRLLYVELLVWGGVLLVLLVLTAVIGVAIRDRLERRRWSRGSRD